jgi:uncharacterized membrane protein YgdD (TMEM256/DUF423 family)
MQRNFGSVGAVFGFLSVALGAFGAHALKDRLSPEMAAVYHTAVEYQMAHSLGLILVALSTAHVPSKLLTYVGWLFVVGIVLFSGSLYLLAVTGVTILGAITPLGGVCFLAGWSLFAVALAKKETH